MKNMKVENSLKIKNIAISICGFIENYVLI